MYKSWIWFLAIILGTGCGKIEVDRHVDVYGHGGGGFMSATNPFPANSEAAIRKALFGYGADGVEVDIQLTADGQIVLYHDRKLESSTDSFGYISEVALENVIKVTYKGAVDISQNFPVLSLEHLLNLLDETGRSVKVSLNLQPQFNVQNQSALMDQRSSELVRMISKDITEKHYIVIESPERDQLLSLAAVTANRPDIHLFYTADATNENIAFAKQINLEGLVSNYLRSSSTMRTTLDDSGLIWSLYGLKIEADIRAALALNPDAVQTDNIPYTLRALNR